MGWGRRRGEQKKKKNSYFLVMAVSLFPVKCVRLCTYLCGLVHFSYLLLCISLWLRVSIYYEAVHPSTCSNRSLSLTSHEIRSFWLISVLSSHFCYFFFSLSLFFTSSTNFLSPTSQLYSGQHVSTQIHLPFHRQYLPTPLLCLSTTLPITFCFITCSPLFLSFLD